MLRRSFVLIIGLAALCVFADGAFAQRGRRRLPQDDNRLAVVTNLKCDFSAATAGEWVGGQARVQPRPPTTPFTLTVAKIDVQEGTGVAVGLGGTTEVTVKLVGANLHILDIRSNGALAVTTVFS